MHLDRDQVRQLWPWQWTLKVRGFYGDVSAGGLFGSASPLTACNLRRQASLKRREPLTSENTRILKRWDSYRRGFLIRWTTATPEGRPRCMESLSLVWWLRRVFHSWLYWTPRRIISFTKRWLIYCVVEKLTVSRRTLFCRITYRYWLVCLTFIEQCTVIYFYSKTDYMHQRLKFILFEVTLYMFRTVFPPIISSRLYIQQQAYVKQILPNAC